MTDFELDPQACRGRQRRLLEVMEAHDLDLVVVRMREHVQWLSGAFFRDIFSPAAALTRGGQLAVVVPERRPPEVEADEVLTYEAKWH